MIALIGVATRNYPNILTERVAARPDAAREFFDRYNRTPETVLSIIGAPTPQNS
jgi:hypothetical protein